MTNWTTQAVHYAKRYPDIMPDELHGLPADVIRRHAQLALSVNRLDVSAEYQAELSRRNELERNAA